ncbi:MAG: 6-phosphogluconolactonase [Gemmatales bacterium]|nr:MAG: 6-phosphogluconolactonase [Gemmatales bacterium]
MIQVFASAEDLYRAAAELFADRAKKAVAQHGRFSVCLSGGSTPKSVFERLAQTPFQADIPWEHCHFFWGDERCVPPDDPRSNARMTREALLDHVPVPAANIHCIDGTAPPHDAAVQYEQTLKSFFGNDAPCFDLVFLGMGPDGHTASLFPGTPVLQEKKRWVAEVYVPQQQMHRVTLTPTVLNRGRIIAFLVTGANKADTLKQVLEGERGRFPAQLIQAEAGDLRWFVDAAAALKLSPAILGN